MTSIWSKTSSLPSREALHEKKETEVAIIGGGMTGILTAYLLKEAGISSVVLEANCIGSGQTQNTTAKITAQHGLIYDKLIKEYGIEKAKHYYYANQTAIDSFEHIIKKEQIACDFTRLPSYLYTMSENDSLKKEQEALQKMGVAANLQNTSELPFPISQSLCFSNQAQFHPLRFLYALASDLDIYEHTLVRSVEKNIVKTDHYEVKAKHILFACHYPFVNFPGLYFTKMHQERSSALALGGLPALSGMYRGVDEGNYSFRSFGQYLLIGGSKHRTGNSKNSQGYSGLQAFANRYYPNATQVARWSAQDCISHDGVPYIGTFSASTPNWYVATGYQKWGMSTSMVAATLLTDCIAKRESPYADVFSPKRFTAMEIPGFLKDTALSVYHLASLSPMPRCTHLGCKLTYNEHEGTYDCPCHGSRFDKEGRVINGPAQKTLSETSSISQ